MYPQAHDPSEPRQPFRRGFLVGLSLPGQPGFVVEEHLDELEELARTAGAEVEGRALQRRRAADSATLIGRGKAREIGEEARSLGSDVIIFDDDLTPGQVRNLEQIAGVAVMDRSALILEIFNQRARSREARTQVELAQLNYMLPRLTRRWGHLSRQEGGIGVRGGEGETQLEVDRRMLRRRIRHLERELEKIERTRTVQRRGRRGTLQVALAGYTNAGKSTLFNRLTQAGTRVEDRLFATLDARLRRGVVDGSQVVVFADTVGFIRKLPHHLVASFKSTLEEVTQADLVLHLVDRSHPHWHEQMEVGERVLADLGVAPERVVTVFNKCDLLSSPDPRPANGLWISAATGEGIPELKHELAALLNGQVAAGPDGSALHDSDV